MLRRAEYALRSGSGFQWVWVDLLRELSDAMEVVGGDVVQTCSATCVRAGVCRGGHTPAHTHSSSSFAGKHVEGYPPSAVMENLLQSFKRPWLLITGHECASYEENVLRNCGSSVHTDGALMTSLLISGEREVLSFLRGGEIVFKTNSTPKKKEICYPKSKQRKWQTV